MNPSRPWILAAPAATLSLRRSKAVDAGVSAAHGPSLLAPMLLRATSGGDDVGGGGAWSRERPRAGAVASG